MKSIAHIIVILFISGHCLTLCGQTASKNSMNIPIVSTAPVSYRVNESGSTLHGYYRKGYSLTIYGDTSAIGYRADCDEDDDWSGATVSGTTQSSNSFESAYKCIFNPHNLYGIVLPANKKGQNHFDSLKKLKVEIGDLIIAYKLDKDNKIVDSIIGVVFDRGPQNQPGESSATVCNEFKTSLGNNQFVYIIFPNTSKYLKQIVGTKTDNKSLKRNPENADFEQAFKLMLDESSVDVRKIMKENLIKLLSDILVMSDFDNATVKEKEEGKLKAKNNDRNLNE